MSDAGCRARSTVTPLLVLVLSAIDASLRADPNPLCGPECLYTALVALDVEPGTYTNFLERVGDVDAQGTSLGRLAELADDFGTSTLTVQTTLENLQRRQEVDPPFACIAHVDGNHFVLIGDVVAGAVWTVNPPEEGLVAAAVFEQRWPGHALLVSRSPLTAEEQLSAGSSGWLAWGLAMALSALLAFGLLQWKWRRQ